MIIIIIIYISLSLLAAGYAPLHNPANIVGLCVCVCVIFDD